MNIRACIGYLFCSFEIFNKIRVKYDMTMVNSERTGLEKSKRFTKYWWSCCNNLNIMPSIVFYIDAFARVSMWRERAFCRRVLKQVCTTNNEQFSTHAVYTALALNGIFDYINLLILRTERIVLKTQSV